MTPLASLPQASPQADQDVAIRAAAFLAATERSTLVLGGTWATHAGMVTTMVPTLIFTINPATAVEETERVSVIVSSEGIPLTPGSLQGVALDATTATPLMLDSAMRTLRPGGRLVAPAAVALPQGINELARDDAYWVGEVTTTAQTSSLVTLKRGV